MNKLYIIYFFFPIIRGLLSKYNKNTLFQIGEQAIGNWKLLYTDNQNFYQQNIKKRQIFNFDKHFVLYDNYNEYNKIELNIYPDYDSINDTIPKLLLKIKKYEKQNMVTYSKIINCNLFMNSYKDFEKSQEIENMQKIQYTQENKQCSLLVLESEKMIKSFGIFEFPHITFLYKSAMNPTYVIKWKIDTLINRLYVYFDKNTYVFEREFYDEMIMNKQSITTNTFIITNVISFIMCKLLEKIFDG